MAINPTAQQLAKQTQITSIINDLQAKLDAVTNKNDIEIAPDLFDLFAAFDINASKSITGAEISALTNHLATINTNANIVKIFLITYKDEIAEMSIDVLEGMLGFYQGQIQQENAKPEPNTSKINQWQTQINAHQSAIAALTRTLS
jgi:hypothetical protein